MKKITFVPVGGLANRMRAIASMMTLAERTNSELRIVWFQDWALHAPFHRLFQPVQGPMANLRDASRLDYLLLDRPRPKNARLPLLFQKLGFSSCLYERSITPLCCQQFDFERWVVEHRCVYMASYTAFYPYPETLVKRLFVPVEAIQQEIDKRCASFAAYMVGVHIRRTDNEASIRQSPIELFYRKLDAVLQQHPEAGIYLATDSEEVKKAMRERYGERLQTSDKQADRSSLAGISEGIVDMYALARTRQVYGSFQSSFSDMAAQIGGIPLEIIQR